MIALEKLLAALAASAILVVGYAVWQTHQQAIGESRAAARFTAAIEDQKRAAAAQPAIETAKAGAASQALVNFKQEQEKRDAQNQGTVDGLAARLRAAATAGRLRATLTQPLPDVGAVVLAPRPQIPALPTLMLQTQPKPAGYFQQALLNYSSGSPARPMPSMLPMPAAGLTC